MQPIFSEVGIFGGHTLLLEMYPRVRRSGYEHLVLATTIDLMQRGFITTVNHEPDHYVLGASIRPDDTKPEWKAAGYIVFEPKLSQELAHVVLGGTTEEFRRSGLYTHLFKTLADVIRSGRRQEHFKDIKKITGCYHVDNESARIMNEKLGRNPVRVTTEYKL